jgi:PTS system nitrogen regulatory IIA component
MRIRDILRKECIIPYMGARTKREAIGELVGVLEVCGLIRDKREVEGVILERERLGSTGIGEGVAIPHGKMKGLTEILISFGRSKEGVDFDAVDRLPVHIFFLLIVPEECLTLHLRMLSRISRLLRRTHFKERLMELDSAEEIYGAISSEEEGIPE